MMLPLVIVTWGSLRLASEDLGTSTSHITSAPGMARAALAHAAAGMPAASQHTANRRAETATFALGGLWRRYWLFRVAVVIASVGLLILMLVLGMPIARAHFQTREGGLKEPWILLKRRLAQQLALLRQPPEVPVRESNPSVSEIRSQDESFVQTQDQDVKRITPSTARQYLEQVRSFREELQTHANGDVASSEIPRRFYPMMRHVSEQLQHQIKKSEVPRLEWLNLSRALESMLPSSSFSTLLARIGVGNGAGPLLLDTLDGPSLIDETMKELEKWLQEQAEVGR